MRNLIQRLFRRSSDRQKYVRDEVSLDNFTEIVSGETLNGEESVRYVSGIEFVLPENCPYTFVDNEEDEWEITLRSPDTPKQNLKQKTEHNENEDDTDGPWYELHSEGFEYEISGLISGGFAENFSRSPYLDFRIKNINQQRIQITFLESHIDFSTPKLQKFKDKVESEDYDREIRCSSELKLLDDVVLEVELNGQIVISMKLEKDKQICSSSLGWQKNDDTCEIELYRTEPIEKRSPAERFADLE